MEIRKEIQLGRRKMIIIMSASGEDKTREAVKRVMGDGYEYEDNTLNNSLPIEVYDNEKAH